jgi:glycosyltransferase involved in cell wall biosynthesis
MILGTRGVPAAHGGFETFAERLALYLSQKDWQVTVYCQEDESDRREKWEDTWNGVRRVHVPIRQSGSLGTVVFDWKATIDSARSNELKLTLGYNTALFCARYRIGRHTNLINMDGIEWRRQKWGKVAKLWFWLNEWAGCKLGHHLVADHPEIKRHLERQTPSSKITTIPYGADRIETANASILADYKLESVKYAILIARAEPENSVLEVVKAWSRRQRDGWKLVILGKYDPEHAYQRSVMQAASDDVMFLGAIYEPEIVKALRFFARLYVHGHQVGGTNPSLVEALGAGNPVLAHDNRFNRWVAGPGAQYFDGEDGCESTLTTLLDDEVRLDSMREASLARYHEDFTWDKVLGDYESLLEAWAEKT